MPPKKKLCVQTGQKTMINMWVKPDQADSRDKATVIAKETDKNPGENEHTVESTWLLREL